MNSAKVKSICPKCYKNGDDREYSLEYKECRLMQSETAFRSARFGHYYKCPNGHEIELWDIIQAREEIDRLEESLIK